MNFIDSFLYRTSLSAILWKRRECRITRSSMDKIDLILVAINRMGERSLDPILKSKRILSK